MSEREIEEAEEAVSESVDEPGEGWPPRRLKTYSIKDKRQALALAHESSVRHAADQLNIPRRTLRGWVEKEEATSGFAGSEKRTTLGGQGRPESIPFAKDLMTFMKDHVRENKIVIKLVFTSCLPYNNLIDVILNILQILVTRTMLSFIKTYYKKWLLTYTADKNGYDAIMRLCQHFAHRHGFSQQKPVLTKERAAHLAETRARFAVQFWGKFSYSSNEIYNVDETGVYYDMPPGKVWGVRGSATKVRHGAKHSDRLTAVLTIRADGKKLPILFIVKGRPGETVDTKDTLTFPKGHVYCVQHNAWMDSTVWEFYIRSLLRFEIDSPAVLLLDNLACHVSETAQETIAVEACATVVPFPPNSTSVCQPLDAGVMGPLKSKMRSLWLQEATQSSAKGKRMAMIRRTITAWESIDAETIRKAFCKAIPQAVEDSV